MVSNPDVEVTDSVWRVCVGYCAIVYRSHHLRESSVGSSCRGLDSSSAWSVSLLPSSEWILDCRYAGVACVYCVDRIWITVFTTEVTCMCHGGQR